MAIKLTHKKARTRQVSSHFDQTSLDNKGFIVIITIMAFVGMFLADRSSSESQHRIWCIWSTHRASHIISDA